MKRSETRKILVPYAIVVLLAYIGFSLPLPILPGMFLDPVRSILPGADLQTKMILLGLVMAAFPMGQFFGSPILGNLSDRFGRKKIVLISLSGTMLGYLTTSYAVHVDSVWGMFLGLSLCGFCEGNVSIAQSVIADLLGKEKHHHQEKAVHFGWINIFISIGFVVGPLVGGQMANPKLVNWFTFATPFWVAACMTFVGMLIILFYSKETLRVKITETNKLNFLSAMWSGLKKPHLKRLYLANFFLALGYFAFFRFYPVFLERKFQFSASLLSYVMVYDSIAITAGVIWLIPFLSKRFTPIQSLSAFSFLLAATFLISLIPEPSYALLLTLPPLGFCLAVVITYGSVLISNAAPQEFQGQALGTLTSVQVLAEFLTGIAGGPLAAYTMQLPLYIGAAMAAVCGCILIGKRHA